MGEGGSVSESVRKVVAHELDITAKTLTFFVGTQRVAHVEQPQRDWIMTWDAAPAERTYAVPALDAGGAWTSVITGEAHPITDYVWYSHAISVATGRPQFNTWWERWQFDPVTRAGQLVKSTSLTRWALWDVYGLPLPRYAHSYRYDGSDPASGLSYEESSPTTSTIQYINVYAQNAFGYDAAAKALRDDALAWATSL